MTTPEFHTDAPRPRSGDIASDSIVINEGGGPR